MIPIQCLYCEHQLWSQEYSNSKMKRYLNKSCGDFGEESEIKTCDNQIYLSNKDNTDIEYYHICIPGKAFIGPKLEDLQWYSVECNRVTQRSCLRLWYSRGVQEEYMLPIYFDPPPNIKGFSELIKKLDRIKIYV